MQAWKRHQDYLGPCALAAAAGLSGMMQLVGSPTGLGLASCKYAPHLHLSLFPREIATTFQGSGLRGLSSISWPWPWLWL